MDTYRKRSITTLRIAGAMLFALCFATETLAQEISTAINDASATSTIAVTEIAATTIEVPDTETPPNTVEELANGLNTVWMMLAAMLVFFMQPGFALVEAGFTRVKNTANILMKNFVDFMFGSLLYWFIGFGLMFGAGGFIGIPHFFDLSFYDGGGLPSEGFLVFQTVFCATAATKNLHTQFRNFSKFLSKIRHAVRIYCMASNNLWIATVWQRCENHILRHTKLFNVTL